MTEPDAVSIIVEWDNVRFADVTRGQRLLEMLRDQTREMPGVYEIAILYNEDAIDGSRLREVADRALGLLKARTHMVPTGGLAYYQLKNEGVRRTGGNLVVLVDSDVLPEAGWLRQLLQPFADPAVDVVAGSTYIEHEGLYGQAMALGWAMFPPRPATDGTLSATSWFFANNVAFRRAVFERHYFPEDLQQSRGQCYRLAEALRANGTAIYMSSSARAAHPAPHGTAHFVRTAVCEGHDRFQYLRMRGALNAVTLSATARRVKQDVRRAWRAVVRRRAEVCMSLVRLPVALALVTSFYALCGMGEILARWAPGVVRRHFAL
ncbi:MAG TPA: glycosyltransferase family 2 protein [Candidatus Methylomirabilis sp.]|nr:glycosyltransferase family 2 protein [Candidatus Methylomirabilis sp.]